MVTQVKLMPDAAQASVLERTLRTVNDSANRVSKVAFEHGVPRAYELRKHTYAELKARGLGAQAVHHVIKKVREAYTTLKANIRAGNLGKPQSKRRRTAESKPIMFRPQAAQPYDDRCLSWQYDQRTVSIWTIAGRLKGVRFVCSADSFKVLQAYRKGECDLIERDGVFYLIATCEVFEAEPYERRKRTKSARRRLKERSRREPRHAANQNHIVAKTIVTEAERTSAGISLEELKGIRQRVRLRKPPRVALHARLHRQQGQAGRRAARFCRPPVPSQTCC